MRVIAQRRAQKIHQSKAQVGVQQPVDRGGGRMLDEAMNQFCLPAGLGQSVSVDGGHGSVANLEGSTERVELEAEIPFPEMMVPTVVVPPYHYNRHPSAEQRQLGGNVEASAGNNPGIAKPEVEQVAIHQQAVAQSRAGPEELEQRLLHPRRRHS